MSYREEKWQQSQDAWDKYLDSQQHKEDKAEALLQVMSDPDYALDAITQASADMTGEELSELLTDPKSFVARLTSGVLYWLDDKAEEVVEKIYTDREWDRKN